MCDNCNESSETRRVSATGFFQADSCVRRRLARERRGYFELCAPCVAHANAGGVIGAPRFASMPEVAVTLCSACFVPVQVVQTVRVTVYDRKTYRQVLEARQQSRCLCGEPAYVVGAAVGA